MTIKEATAAIVLSSHLAGTAAYASWQPSPDAVARLLRTRTKVSSGAELGFFTDATRPTDAEVRGLIKDAVDEVAKRVSNNGDLCNSTLSSDAGNMAVLYTAMLIELSYFPEQVENNHSPYDRYKDLYDEGMKSLLEAVAETCGGDSDGDVVGGDPDLPNYDFRTSTRPVGRETVW